MKLYNKKNAATSNSSSQSENESMMDADIQKVDKAVQTDSITESSTTDITRTETKSVSTVATSSAIAFATFESLSLPFFKLAKSHQKCSICKNYFAKTKKHSCDVDNEMLVNSLLDHHVYIQENSRCCTDLFIDGKLNQKSIEIIKKNELNISTITRDELIKLFEELKKEIRDKEKRLNNLKDRPPLNFDDHEEPMSDNNYYVLTGLTRDQFNNLCSYIPPCSLRHSDIRTSRMAIAILLVKLRLGLSHRALCTLFGLEDKMQISRILDSACSALTKYFVPKHLGFQHITRTDVILKHTRPLAQQLLADDDPTKAIIILDGTYVYIQKSYNNTLQRRTFSLHKGTSLVKPMMIVSSDGYIIAVLGPFFADGKNNASEITKNLLYRLVEKF